MQQIAFTNMASSEVVDLTGRSSAAEACDVVVIDDEVSEVAVSEGSERRKRKAPSETVTSLPSMDALPSSEAHKVMSFTVPGKPRPLKRHKHGKGHNFNPSAVEQGKFFAAVTSPWPSTPLKGPIKVVSTFVFEFPKRRSGKASQSQMYPCWRSGRPGKCCHFSFIVRTV